MPTTIEKLARLDAAIIKYVRASVEYERAANRVRLAMLEAPLAQKALMSAAEHAADAMHRVIVAAHSIKLDDLD